MKPKIFIGSSVEGLPIARAIQNNLYHDAEVNLWNQGMFELSDTTIESLVEIVNRIDFGIFVFSPDDITKFKSKKVNTVRDNVIFELGLFIGKIGRKRTFIIIPEKANLHIPTDLLGVTPGKFKADRDDNLDASTGPFCNQVIHQIKKEGLLNIVSESSTDNVEKKEELPKELNNSHWVDSFLEKDFKNAVKSLDIAIDSEKDEVKRIDLMRWKLYSEALRDNNLLTIYFNPFIEEYQDKLISFTAAAECLLWEDYLEDAMKVVDKGILNFGSQTSLVQLKVSILEKEGKDQEAVAILENSDFKDREPIQLRLAEKFEKEKDLSKAREVLHKAYLIKPNSEQIRYKYSRIAMEINEKEIALFLLKKLTEEYPQNSEYWGYLSNACVMCELLDKGLQNVKKANDITNSKEAWLLANIGNIYNRQKLPSDAISYLNKALELMKDHSYSHERLASAIKAQEEEDKKFDDLMIAGRNKLRSFQIQQNSI